MLMVFANLWLVVGWAIQLEEEEQARKEVRMKWLDEEIARWEQLVVYLERERYKIHELEVSVL
jgi:hypothetical protein